MIGPKILEEIKKHLGQLLDEHLDLIDQAFVRNENGLAISMSAKIKPSDKHGFLALEIGITFVPHRVKKSKSCYVNESQGLLFKAEGVTTVTISSGKESVILTSKTRKKIDSALARDAAQAKEESRNAGS
jgi:hypothetical protein